jgi:hypothetical protein
MLGTSWYYYTAAAPRTTSGSNDWSLVEISYGNRQAYERQVAQVRTLLGAEAFARAWAAGRALILE